MTMSMIGRYQLSQSRTPLVEACTASTPRPAQTRNTGAQIDDRTRLTRLNTGVCHTEGGGDSFA